MNELIEYPHRIRINRYMLGCKYSKKSLSGRINRELIDTCWDVNIRPLQLTTCGEWN